MLCFCSSSRSGTLDQLAGLLRKQVVQRQAAVRNPSSADDVDAAFASLSVVTFAGESLARAVCASLPAVLPRLDFGARSASGASSARGPRTRLTIRGIAAQEARHVVGNRRHGRSA